MHHNLTSIRRYYDEVGEIIKQSRLVLIICAFIKDSVESFPEFYLVEVLEWGARVWKNESKNDRGAIFEPSFTLISSHKLRYVYS